jgi:hypothetical protein
MNISKSKENRIPSQDIIRYKQRLVATTEVFDADLAVCFVKQEQAWSVVALEGKLVDEHWHKNLPMETLKKTVEERKGVVVVEPLGELPDCNHSVNFTRVACTMSALYDDGKTVFVIAKLLSKGVFKKNDAQALARFLESFDL